MFFLFFETKILFEISLHFLFLLRIYILINIAIKYNTDESR